MISASELYEDLTTIKIESKGVENINSLLRGFCYIVRFSASPKYYTYYVNLYNLNDFNKIDKFLSKLSLQLHTSIKRTQSFISHFAFEIEKRVIDTIPFKWSFASNTNLIGTIGRLSAYIGEGGGYLPIYIDLKENTHILIAGSTGSGKSVCLNSIICSLLCKNEPSQLRFIMIDPKYVELFPYRKIKHLLAPIAHDVEKAKEEIEKVLKIMEQRYKYLAIKGLKNIDNTSLCDIVVVIDEYADLILSDPLIQDDVVKLAQKGRACGIHLIIATQRPVATILNGLVKTNLTTRIALHTASIRDSINILDHKGAEQLRGYGDAIIKTNSSIEEINCQVAYISNEEIERICSLCEKG